MSRLELEYTDKWSFVYIEIYYKNIPINICHYEQLLTETSMKVKIFQNTPSRDDLSQTNQI